MINSFRNFINDAYISFYINLNKILLKSDNLDLINKQVNELAQDLFQNNPEMEREIKSIKYKVIKKYKHNRIDNSIDKNSKEKIFHAIKMVWYQLCIDLLPNTIIDSGQIKININEDKKRYIEKLKYSKDKEDKKTIKLLESESLQKLAKQFDTEIDSNISLQDFAKLIIKYNEALLKILSEENKKSVHPSDVVGGADEIFMINEAFFLLQKNIKYSAAIKQLLQECTLKNLDLLIAAVNPHLAGEASLTNFQN